MDFVTVGISVAAVAICGLAVFLLSIYGTTEQSFEDGLLRLDEKKKKWVKKDDVPANSQFSRKKSGKSGKKQTDTEDEAAKPEPPAKKQVAAVVETVVPETVPVVEVPIKAKEKKPEQSSPKKVAPIKEAKNEQKAPTKAGKSKIVIEEVEGPETPAQVEPKVEEIKPEIIKPKTATVVNKAPVVVETQVEVTKVEVTLAKDTSPVQETKQQAVPKKDVKKKASAKKDKINDESFSDWKVQENRVYTLTGIDVKLIKSTQPEERMKLLELLLSQRENIGLNGNQEDDEWVGDKTADSMKRKLADTEKYLQLETDKTRSLSEKINELREELNRSKILLRSEQKKTVEIQAQHQLAINGYEARLKTEIEARTVEVNKLKVEHEKKAAALQEKYSKMESTEVDSGKKAEELSKANQTVAKLESELKAAVQHKNEANAAKDKVESELVKTINTMKTEFKNKEEQLVAEIKENLQSQNELKANISNLKGSLEALNAEALKLKNEKNEKHSVDSSNAASAKLAPLDKTEYQREEIAATKLVKELISNKDFKPEDTRPTLYDSLAQFQQNAALMNGSAGKAGNSHELEVILARGDALIRCLADVVVTTKSDLSQAQAEVEAQKHKNNELRQKNWKAVEALNTAEQNFQKKIQETTTAAKTSVQNDGKSKEAAFKEIQKSLETSFPELKLDKSTSDFQAWTKSFVEKVKAKAADEFQTEKSTLEKKANNFQVILAQTEETLKTLQTEVESMEQGYQKRIEDMTNKMADALAKELRAIEESASLRSKLELSEKKIGELLQTRDQLEADLNGAENSSKALDSLELDLDRLKQTKKELTEQVSKLQAMLSANQKAFEHEKMTTEGLRQQLAKKETPVVPSESESTPTANGDSKHTQGDTENKV